MAEAIDLNPSLVAICNDSASCNSRANRVVKEDDGGSKECSDAVYFDGNRTDVQRMFGSRSLRLIITPGSAKYHSSSSAASTSDRPDNSKGNNTEYAEPNASAVTAKYGGDQSLEAKGEGTRLEIHRPASHSVGSRRCRVHRSHAS